MDAAVGCTTTVRSARIAVVAVQVSGKLATAGHAAVTGSTLVAIATGNTVQGLVHAAQKRITRIFSTRIAVIALKDICSRDTFSGAAAIPQSADVVVGAGPVHRAGLATGLGVTAV